MKCCIQWIDNHGNPTPDNNEAIGMAVCYDPKSFGNAGCQPIPICKDHFIKLLMLEHWQMKPLPQINEAINKFSEFHNITDKSIFENMIYHTLGDYWTFRWKNITFGIERNGYIHL